MGKGTTKKIHRREQYCRILLLSWLIHVPRRGGLSLTPCKRSAAWGEGRGAVWTLRLEDARSTECAHP